MSGTLMAGRRIWITRPREGADVLPWALGRAGAEVIWAPTIAVNAAVDTTALDRALAALGSTDWVVFTSSRAARVCVDRLRALGIDRSALSTRRIAAVGPRTAAALTDRGVSVEVIASPHSANGLIAALSSRIRPGAVVLYPRARSVSPVLGLGLRALSAHVVDVVAYETATVPVPARLARTIARGVDGVAFCSPSAVRGARPHRSCIAQSIIACIGPATARAARSEGLPVHVVPPHATASALADAIVNHFARAAR